MKDIERLMNIWKLYLINGKLNEDALNSYSLLLREVSMREWEGGNDKAHNIRERYELLLKKMAMQIPQSNKDYAQNAMEAGIVTSKPIRQALPKPVSKTNLLPFFDEVNRLNADEFIFIFSGTAQVQNVKRNRPIQFALEFQKQGIPVLYSYWRWQMTETIPVYDNKGLFQIPIDHTMTQMMEIIQAPIHQNYKVLLFEFPYPPASKYLEVFQFYGWKVIYDIRDDWEEFYKIGQAKWYQKAHELYTIEKANCSIAVSQTLVNKFASITHTPVKLLPNALDNNTLPIEQRVSRRKIGYVGHLTSGWFDWEAMIEIAEGLPEYEFEIIGHSMPTTLHTFPSNLNYLGPKPYDELPQYITEWKIGIIPFRINRLTQAVDPIKVYEYLSMGLKVVSFDMPQIADYPEVKIAHTPWQFIQTIRESMREAFNEEVVERFLIEHTWTKRVEWIRRWYKQ